jgi:hypothetical protein
MPSNASKSSLKLELTTLWQAILALQGACVGKIAGYHTQGTAMGLLMGCMAVT